MNKAIIPHEENVFYAAESRTVKTLLFRRSSMGWLHKSDFEESSFLGQSA